MFCQRKPVQLFSLFPLSGTAPLDHSPWPLLIPSLFLQVLALNCPHSFLCSFPSPCLSLSFPSIPFTLYPPEVRTGTRRIIQGWKPKAKDTRTEDSETSQSTWTAVSSPDLYTHHLKHLSEGHWLCPLALPASMPGAPTRLPFTLTPSHPVLSQFNSDKHLLGTCAMQGLMLS